MKNNSINNRSILFLLFAMPLLAGMCIDLYVPSLPNISDYYQIGNHLSQLTISAYMLSYSIGQVFLGPFADRYGRRKIVLFGGIIFTLASFVAALSPNIYTLILSRFLQGCGIAGLGIGLRAFAIDNFKGLALTKTVTYISIGWAVGPIIGPFIGGYLQHYVNWQMDFYFFGIYGLALLMLIIFKLPETHFQRHPLKLQKILSTFKVTITHPVFLKTCIIASLVYAMLVVFNVIGPFLIQRVLNYSVIAYGHLALLLGTACFLGNFLNRILINYFNPTRVTFYALSAAAVTCLIMLGLGITLKINLYIVVIPAWLIFFLNGMVFPNMAGEFSNIFREHAGTASAISGLFVAGVPFLLSVLATSLKTSSQIPMVLLFITILIACLAMVSSLDKRHKKATAQIISDNNNSCIENA